MKAGKYISLTKWLSECNKANVSLTFSEIESIIGSELPASAYRYAEWWSNHPTHSQANAWMQAGYNAALGNAIITSQIAVFIKQS